MEAATFLSILVLVAGGFGTALKMMHSDMTKRAERAEAGWEKERAERNAERAAMQAALDGYRDRTPEMFALIQDFIAHTESQRADLLPQRKPTARIRPRNEVRA
jgi:hypothetical protein